MHQVINAQLVQSFFCLILFGLQRFLQRHRYTACLCRSNLDAVVRAQIKPPAYIRGMLSRILISHVGIQKHSGGYRMAPPKTFADKLW